MIMTHLGMERGFSRARSPTFDANASEAAWEASSAFLEKRSVDLPND